MKESMLYRIIRPIVSLFTRIVFNPKIKGREYINNNDKLLLVGNHTSNFDSILLMTSVKRPIHFLAKIELFKGFKGIIFRHMGLISVDRSKHNPEAVSKAKDYLLDRKVVLIFPEGTTEKEGKVLPFKAGAFNIASETNTLITPFVIKGEYKIFKSKISIEFFEPIKVGKDIKKEIDKFKSFIEDKVN